MNLMAVATSSTQITLIWGASADNSGVTGYFIERCSGAACGSFSQIATANGTTFSDAGLTASTSYSYRVRATDTAGNLSGYSNVASATTLAAATISVMVSPISTSVPAGIGMQGFAATLTNDTQNKGVAWSLSGSGCTGTTCGTLINITSTSVTFSAPSNVPSPATVLLTATSAADGTKSASATISITAPISVSVAPTSASVNASLAQQFTATVQNDSQNLGVQWSVNGVAGGNATVGTVSGTGLYTAPASAPSSGVTVTATSAADPTRSGSASVTVLAAVSVSISPPTASVQQSQSQNFTASASNDPGGLGVTWSLSGSGCSGATCGTLSNVTTTSVTYNAPATLPSPAAVTLTGTSKRDSTKSNSATITLTVGPPIVVTLSPTTVSMNTNGTQNFTVSVQNDSQNKGVTWSLAGSGCSGSACGTLSNVTTTSVTYNAPSTPPNPPKVTLTATSVSDGAKSAAATINLTAITVSVSPKRGGMVASQALLITATLTNDAANAGVSWSFASTGASTGGGFSPTSSTSGNPVTFTAPAAPGIVTITATSVVDPSKTATATIGVTNLTGVTTYLGGNSRQGANTQEYALTTSGVTAVNSANFGKLFSCATDAAIYAQPLWVAGVSISGTPHNVVFVATEHDTVYAFDADANPCTQLWKASLIDTAHGAASSTETWVTDFNCTDIAPEIGIVGTPVIDPNTNTLYAVSLSKNSSSTAFYQRIHALDLTTGNEKFSGPTTISATVPGTGVGSSGGIVSFDAFSSNQRSALLLTNGHVIVDWGSHCDSGVYHGWVMSFNAFSLAQEAVFNTSPNGINSGAWMAGNGPATDSSGNIYLAIGNGTFDADSTTAPNNDYGDAILKLGPPKGGTFPVLSYFHSYSLTSPNLGDLDQGSGGLLLLPTVGSHNYLVQAGKDGNVYLVDQASLGGYSSTSNNVVQWLNNAVPGGIWGSPTYWNGNVYFGAAALETATPTDPIRAFSFDTVSTAMLSTSPTSVTSEIFGYPGPTPPISANGTSNGIAWTLENLLYCTSESTGCGPTILHAYDATNLATEFWNSSENAADVAGNAVKFTVPMVVNGKVYVGTRGNDMGSGGTSVPGELDVYGLKPD